MTIVIHPDYTFLSDFVHRLPQSFGDEGELLHSGRNEVRRFRVDGDSWVVKRYKRPNLIQRIVYTFVKKSKAERAYLFAAMLRERGFDTPHEVAYIEERKGGLIRDTYFVSADCTLPPLSDLLLGRDFDRRPATQLAALIVEMHQRGVLHGDMNLTNFLYRTDDAGNYRFTLIDTNRSRFKSQPTKEECLRNMKRVTHNRCLLRFVVMRYAEMRGWNPEESTRTVLRLLLKYERKLRLKRGFFAKIKTKKQ